MSAIRRVVMAGASTRAVCGVRDYSEVVQRALESSGVTVERCWASGPSDIRELRAQLLRGAQHADAVLLNYSVFSFGRVGLPVSVPALATTLKRCPAPVIGILHEFAHDWTGGGRGFAWAGAHRLALVSLVHSLDAVVVTTSDRLEWVRGRPWLPARPTTFVPVPSTLPGHGDVAPATQRGSIGVFGWSVARPQVDLVMSAFERLRRSWGHLALRLIGGPDPDAPIAAVWRERAAEAACADALSFSGVLSTDELAAELRRCQLLVFCDAPGPTSRKTTLTGALGVGQAVVAVDGPNTWPALIEHGAVEVVDRDAGVLAESIARLLDDEQAATRLRLRAVAFYDRFLSPRVVADGLLRSTVAAVVAAGAR